MEETAKEKWSKLIKDWEGSSLSGMAWCRENHQSYASFGYWKKRLYKPDVENRDFIEIVDRSEESGICLRIGKVCLELSKKFDPATLKRCLQVFDA